MSLNVPPAIRMKRYDLCKSCKYFKATTRSCGTLRIFKPLGEKITIQEQLHNEEAEQKNQVTYYRRKVTLCGCVMPLKTWLKGAECPIGKWSSELSREEVEELRLFLQSLPNTISDTEMQTRILKWYNKLAPNGHKLTCASCNVPTMVKELRKQVL